MLNTILLLAGLGGVYIYNSKDWPFIKAYMAQTPLKPLVVSQGQEQARHSANFQERLALSKKPTILHDLGGNKSTLQKKRKIGAAPFYGITATHYPRVPPPYFPPVPKSASRIDWKEPSSSAIFRTDAFKTAHKRMYQILHGTPQMQARRGQLVSDWGYAHQKGFPLHQGRTQSWLAMNYDGKPAPQVDRWTSDISKVQTHHSVLPYLNRHQSFEKRPETNFSSGAKITW